MYTPIHQWAEVDRPREKFLLKGKSALSDSELLAILIGSGSRNESAVQLCQRILASSENNLNTLGKMTVAQLTQFKGIGEAKAIAIAAALELGRRRRAEDAIELKKITSSNQRITLQRYRTMRSRKKNRRYFKLHSDALRKTWLWSGKRIGRSRFGKNHARRSSSAQFWDTWQGSVLRMKIENSREPVKRCVSFLFDRFLKLLVLEVMSVEDSFTLFHRN
jgi:ribosomal protein S13